MRLTSAILLFVLVSSCARKTEGKLKIATAANVQFAMEELVREFEVSNQVKCEIILGSSGQLSAQIKESAPFDVFVSANMDYANDLYKNSLTTSKPEIYSYGVLVLWSSNDTINLSLDVLKGHSIKKIAIANPKSAPYGLAAVQVLEAVGLRDSIDSKIVYGESVSQVNQFVLSGAADIGFTSKSVVVSEQLKNQGKWMEIDRNLYDPIEQGAVVIKGDHQIMAGRFFDFLISDAGQSILERNGYQTRDE